ncbi:MAG: DUF1800 family protein [Bauldia sp.]
MALSPADSFRFARKVGYGLRPDENPGDVLEWAMAQMETVPGSVGIAHFNQPDIKPWPAELNWSLEQRVANLIKYKSGEEKLQKSNDPSAEQKRSALYNATTHIYYDIIRHCADAVFSPTPVFERFANFWANHFTIGENSKSTHVLGHYTDAAIKANMVRDFAALLYDVETHPAMLSYLDAQYSIGPNSKLGREFHAKGTYADINENLAREMMELHSLSPKAGYAQADVREAAKVLTGWGYTMEIPDRDFPPGDRWHQMFRKAWHEPGKKTVLGQVFPEGKEGLHQLTDFLATRDEGREFISFKLAHHFIREEPTADDVAFISNAWRDSKGSMIAINKAVLQRATEPDARKFQQPECWLYQMLRISGASLFVGYEELEVFGPAERHPEKILDELGQNNWSIRQPNGFSDARSDWISPEHMERRVRLAQLTQRSGSPKLQANDIADRYQVLPETRALMEKSPMSDYGKFMLLFCSPEFTEA